MSLNAKPVAPPQGATADAKGNDAETDTRDTGREDESADSVPEDAGVEPPIAQADSGDADEAAAAEPLEETEADPEPVEALPDPQAEN